ncbi:MAG: serine hydrolase [Flavipsychrobacter sp.]|nr:serine hydrolase [Flavipsychrobacter sp.]
MHNSTKLFVTIVFIVSLSVRLSAQSLYFPPVTGSTWDTTSPATLGWCQDKIDSLISYAGQHNTKALLLLKDGKMVVEHYYGTFTTDSAWQWNSAGKSLTAFLTGLAQEQGYINIHDSLPKYLGHGFSSCTANNEDSIRIYHQLTMTTGFDDMYGSIPNNPCYADSCLVCIAASGIRWAYHNAPYTLIHHIIDSATHQSINAYTSANLIASCGITGAWISPPSSPYDEIFFSKARSMARFGLLILGKGMWGTTTVLHDTTYLHNMLNTSQPINYSYGYLWWLNGKSSFHLPQTQVLFPGMLEPDAPADMVTALGKNDQLINVVPSMGIVLIRMGDAASSSQEVSTLFNDTLWIKLNAAFCNTSASNIQRFNAKPVLYPNPVQQTLYITFTGQKFSITLTDMTGRNIIISTSNTEKTTIDCKGLTPGIYFARIVTEMGRVYNEKVLVEQ